VRIRGSEGRKRKASGGDDNDDVDDDGDDDDDDDDSGGGSDDGDGIEGRDSSRDKNRPGEILWLNSLLIKGFGGV